MPKTLIEVNTSDGYTDQGGANINSVYNSTGGWVAIANSVFAEIQHSSFPGETQGAEQWGDEFLLPAGAHYLQPGIIGIRFRSFASGNPVPVSAAIFFRDEPAVVLGGSGIASPGNAVAALNFQHNDLAIATEPTADFEDEATGTTFVWTLIDDPANTRVKITPVWENPTIFPHPISTGPINNGRANVGGWMDLAGRILSTLAAVSNAAIATAIEGDTNWRASFDLNLGAGANQPGMSLGSGAGGQDITMVRQVNVPTGTGSFLEMLAGEGIGYGTGSGGIATIANNGTGTINQPSGKVTASGAVANGANYTTTVDDTVVGIDDVIIVNCINAGAGAATSFCSVINITAGSFTFTWQNNSGGNVTPIFTFAVIKGAVS